MSYLIKEVSVQKKVVVVKYLHDDNEEELKLFPQAYASFFIYKDKTISDEEFLEITKLNNYYLHKTNILKKLKYQYLTEYEVKKLMANSLTPKEIETLIEELKAHGYLNDYEYLKEIFSKAYSKQKGKNYLINKLKDLKINANLIDSFLSKYQEETLGYKLAEEIYQKNRDSLTKTNLLKKISSKLNYNGYSDYLIETIINEYQNKPVFENKNNLIKDYQKLLHKYQGKYQDKKLEYKIIESLMIKGYNYKSIKEVVRGSTDD